jgi:hypothetical protein
MDARGSIPDRVKYLSLHLSIHANCGAHQAANSMDPRSSYPPQREVDHSPPFGVEDKNGGGVLSFTYAPSWHSA